MPGHRAQVIYGHISLWATELPTNVPHTARQILQQLQTYRTTLLALEVTAPDFRQRVTDLESTLASADSIWRDGGRIHIRAAAVELQTANAASSAILERMRSAEADATALHTALKAKAADVGTLKLAFYYEEEAKKHARVAWITVGGLAAVTAASVYIGFQILEGIPIPEEKSDDWTFFARNALARAFIVAALSYGIAFTARIYRSNAHLRAVYMQKASALKTYHLFSASRSNEDDRTMILAELVRAVFSAADTGVLDKGGSDHTVVETAVPIAAALARPRG